MANKNQNSKLYFIVGALAVAVIGLGYMFYQNQNQSTELSISVSDQGIVLKEK